MLIDIEKIEEVLQSRTVNDKYIELFTEKIKKLNNEDLAAIESMFTQMSELVWKSSPYCSDQFAMYHKPLSDSITKMYERISVTLGYKFHARYLTDKFAICTSMYSFITKNKKAV